MDLGEQAQEVERLPLFCAKTTDQISGQTVYVNFRASSAIEPPKMKISEESLVRETINPSSQTETLRVPVQLSALYWRTDDRKAEKEYVIDAEINDKFALRDVISSELATHFVIHVTMTSVDQKFNEANSQMRTHQFLGHKLSLDLLNYEILKEPVKRSSVMVHNKIVIVEPGSEEKPDMAATECDTEDDPGSDQCDLYFRPNSMLFTCSLQTDRCPESISFGGDRICVEAKGGRVIFDTYLPLEIDLNEPVKYKFDDRLCLFRLVCKLREPGPNC